MGRAGLRQRLGVGFERQGPLGWGSPFELKKKRGAEYRYHGVEKHLTNKQSLQNGVMPVAVGLRLGELVVHRCGSREA